MGDTPRVHSQTVKGGLMCNLSLIRAQQRVGKDREITDAVSCIKQYVPKHE